MTFRTLSRRLVLGLAPVAVLTACSASAGYSISVGDTSPTTAPDTTTTTTTALPATTTPATTVAADALPPVLLPVPAAPSPAEAPAKLGPPPADPGLATPVTARGNANCQGIEAEFLRQGAEADVADQFAYVIAPRESGCVPQLVSTGTDLSYSRLGLNFIGVMPTYWGRLCGVTDYHATADLSVDVRCGLAAYRALGWRPWS